MLRSPCIWILFLCTITAVAPAQSPDPANDEQARAKQSEELSRLLMPIIEAHDGQVSVAVRHLRDGVSFDYHSDRTMPTASLIKFPLLAAVFHEIEQGNASLDDKIVLKKEDKVPGSGLLTDHFSDGVELPLRDILHLMIVFSDNTATNLAADHIGLNKTAELMNSLGFPETRLNSKSYNRDSSIFPNRSQKYGLGSTTAADMVTLLTLLYEKQLVSPTASRQMYELMLKCNDKSKIARDLPADTKVANKTGEVSAARTDAALIKSPSGPIAICVLTNQNADQQWGDNNTAHLLCANIGKTVYDFFNRRMATDDSPRPLAIGANGLLVEGLQRTLNAQAKPPANLTVDGDFGPATKAAVVAFQESRGLTATGIVDAKTWQALGTIVDEDAVDAPAIINQQPWSTTPPAPLTGPPLVTCKGWVIGDPIANKILWQDEADTRLHPASTTKIMTGYLVVEYAAKHPEVLHEMITFSKTADQTTGSTSGVRSGEQISVRELLYGLLLPSGNDASVAFAESLGDRIGSQGSSNYDRFVAAMNDKAQQLGMTKTHYANTHGLTDPTHLTTANDLFKLASAAMKFPLFAQIVATPIHGATVRGDAGYRRNVVWKNSNRLLKIAGYQGIKTGTTNAAGSCLVSQATRNDKTLIVVVLGSAATDSRYVDSRNLYRYAWQQLKNKTDHPAKE